MYDMKIFRRSFKNFDESLAVGKFSRADKIFIEIDKSAKEKFYSNAGAEIYTHWEGIDEINYLQKNYFDDEGNLIVEIGKDFEK